MPNLFKCLSCERSISIPSCWIYEESELMCSSCKTEEKKQINKSLDAIEQWTKIPCPIGCGGRGLPKQIEDHVAICAKRKCRYLCLYKNCGAIKTIDELYDHVEKEHKSVETVNISDGFGIIGLPEQTDVLIKLQNGDSLFTEFYWMIFRKQEDKTLFTVQHICTVDNENGHLSANKIFTKFVVRNLSLVEVMSINGSIQSVKNLIIFLCPVDVTILDNQSMMVQLKRSSADWLLPRLFVNQMFCVSCELFMTGFIYCCSNGHSSCSNCRIKNTHGCKKCGSKNIFQNMDMENMRNDAATRCKYYDKGCKVIVRIENMMEHEAKCLYRDFTCPDCCSSFTTLDVFRKHFDNCSCSEINLGQPYRCCPNENNAGDEMYVMFYDDELFVLYIWTCLSDDPDLFRFMVEHHNTNSNEKYYFDLTISDPIDDKSICFESKCDCFKEYRLPRGNFVPGRDLEYVLNIHQDIESLSYFII